MEREKGDKDERHRKHDQQYIHSKCVFFLFFLIFTTLWGRWNTKSPICKLDFETKSLKLRNLSNFENRKNYTDLSPPMQIFHVSFVLFFNAKCHQSKEIFLKTVIVLADLVHFRNWNFYFEVVCCCYFEYLQMTCKLKSTFYFLLNYDTF